LLLVEPSLSLVLGEGLEPIPLLVVLRTGDGFDVEIVVGFGRAPAMTSGGLV
jgi:hypothetical protein